LILNGWLTSLAKSRHESTGKRRILDRTPAYLSRLRHSGRRQETSSSQAVPDDLGARVAWLRKMHGLSQRELARRAGMTNGAISLIEKNLSSPQLASLRKILAVFPISIAEFFSMKLKGDQQIFFSKHDLVEIGGKDISLRLVAGQNRNRTLQLIHERFAPGSDTGKQMLSHEGEEAGVVIRGRVEVTVGRRSKVLGPGEAYYFASTLPHRFRNLDSEECEVVSAATPPTF
jgi:transcriptional regulator with XRE-family HTH domain